MEPRRVLTSVKGVTAKSLAKMEAKMVHGGIKKRKEIFREFLQDVIRKATPAGQQQQQQPKKPTIKELPEKLIIRKHMQDQRRRPDDDSAALPFDLDEL
jgi:hypothetical protein